MDPKTFDEEGMGSVNTVTHDAVHEALAIAVAEGLPTGTAMRAVLLVTDHGMPPAEAVEASECWGFDDRVKSAGTKRNALVADALRLMQAREYGEDDAA